MPDDADPNGIPRPSKKELEAADKQAEARKNAIFRHPAGRKVPDTVHEDENNKE